MICKWLAMAYDFERFGKPSWDMLAKAVANPAGGDNRRLAEDIAKEHPFIDTSEPSPPPVPARLGKCVCVCVCARVSRDVTSYEALRQLPQYSSKGYHSTG